MPGFFKDKVEVYDCVDFSHVKITQVRQEGDRLIVGMPEAEDISEEEAIGDAQFRQSIIDLQTQAERLAESAE